MATTQAPASARRVLSELTPNVSRLTPTTQKSLGALGAGHLSLLQDHKLRNIWYATMEPASSEGREMGDQKRLRIGDPDEFGNKRNGMVYDNLKTKFTLPLDQDAESQAASETETLDDANNLSSSQETVIRGEAASTESEPTHPTPLAKLRASIPQSILQKRAEAVKLRLRIANYRVETNQIGVPISELEVRGQPEVPTLPKLPRFSESFTCSKRRTPLPATIPDITIRRPSSAPRPRIPSSPPSSSSSDTDDESLPNPFVTPLLARRRVGLSMMANSASPTPKDSHGGDLTSSVVKKSAADSLLHLKHQNDLPRSV